MEQGFERKFLVKYLPNLFGNVPMLYEKYFIQPGDVIEETVLKKDDILEYEKKTCLSGRECSLERSLLSQEEFEKLKALAPIPLVYKQYLYSVEPYTLINIYKGTHEGFARADVTFKSEEEADDFEVLGWMGKEITHAVLGIDKQLTRLSHEECIHLLHREIASTNS